MDPVKTPVKVQGVDPKLNEEQILATLDPSIVLTPNGIRSLMSLILLCCYDRQVDREFMADIIDRMAELGIVLAQLECAGKMHAALEVVEADRQPAALNGRIEELMVKFTRLRTNLYEKFKLVTMCPTADDKIS